MGPASAGPHAGSAVLARTARTESRRTFLLGVDGEQHDPGPRREPWPGPKSRTKAGFGGVDEVKAAAADTGAILTVEEHNLTGGLGSAVAEILLDLPRIVFQKHGVPDKFVEVGPPAALYAHYRLDAQGVTEVAKELLARKG